MVSSEARPWAKSGGLADVVGSLPSALTRFGHKVSVVIPRYMDAARAPANRIADRVPIYIGGQHWQGLSRAHGANSLYPLPRLAA